MTILTVVEHYRAREPENRRVSSTERKENKQRPGPDRPVVGTRDSGVRRLRLSSIWVLGLTVRLNNSRCINDRCCMAYGIGMQVVGGDRSFLAHPQDPEIISSFLSSWIWTFRDTVARTDLENPN